jgi:hypothetical protein
MGQDFMILTVIHAYVTGKIESWRIMLHLALMGPAKTLTAEKCQ